MRMVHSFGVLSVGRIMDKLGLGMQWLLGDSAYLPYIPSVLYGPGLGPRAGPARSPWAGPGQVSIIVCGPGRVRA